jgi:hypothetical protein
MFRPLDKDYPKTVLVRGASNPDTEYQEWAKEFSDRLEDGVKECGGQEDVESMVQWVTTSQQ